MEKRTDRKGRLLHNGESQRKDGRYAYKYIENGSLSLFILGNLFRLTEYQKEKEIVLHFVI